MRQERPKGHRHETSIVIWSSQNERRGSCFVRIFIPDSRLGTKSYPRWVTWCQSCGAIKLEGEVRWRKPK